MAAAKNDDETLYRILNSADSGNEICVSVFDEEFAQAIGGIKVTEAVDLASHLIEQDTQQSSGTSLNSKFRFRLFNGTCIDYILATGCPNCGKPICLRDFRRFYGESGEINDWLTCSGCMHALYPIADATTCDNLAHAVADDDENDPDDAKLAYMFGSRQGVAFQGVGNQWWRQSMQGAGSSLLSRLTQATTANKAHKQIVTHPCDKCGFNQQRYSTFQARSADEGMTVMYECVQCGHRRVINT